MFPARLAIGLVTAIASAGVASGDADLRDLVAKVKPSVVTVVVHNDDDGNPDGQGTGWVYADRQVVTSFHVVKQGKRAEVRLADGRIVAVEGVVADLPEQDLALLSVPATRGFPPPLQLSATKPTEGQKVFVVGSPMGLEHSVTDGIISSVRDLPPYGAIVQTTAAISPGSSGSPILDFAGNVLAVATFTLKDGQGLNFGVSVHAAKRLKAGAPTPLAELATREARALLTRHVFLAATAAGKKDYSAALLSLDFALRENPQNRIALALKGLCLDELGRTQEAIGCFKQAIDTDPEFAAAHHGLGISYAKLGRFEEAIECCKRASRLSPDTANTQLALAILYITIGRRQEAIECYKEAIRIEPSRAETHCDLGTAYAKLGRLQEAIECYEQAIRVKPDYYDAHYSLGLVYFLAGRTQEAIEAYKQAIRSRPDDSEAQVCLGFAYNVAGRPQVAVECFKQALKNEPHHADAHLGLGLAYLQIDDRAAALKQYEILKRIDPERAQKLFNSIYP